MEWASCPFHFRAGCPKNGYEAVRADPWVVRYGATSGAKRLNMRTSPPLTHPTQLPDSRFPIPDSRFPTPCSLFPVPCSLNKKIRSSFG
ncbi:MULTISPECIES: hypothetical protein [unclassified Moorena]|uniref:hypothetical protein n=1 Tax=unclassified Moorena TaxID=2683338 RepID=UPI0013BDBDD9|nr:MULTISPECIES: hypothetical protein [unclassified Moorena]NEP36702.1 hypothetical protein [Moorena sp. SIO3B2]NEQ06527.1 hypothetical protein [Moorena sp. SIO4E2]NES46199.1 hypothetical protein [Moorena sp. SIO2C4]NET68108.1 hypothetical protein [Moorena sp. SIO1G6]